MNKRIQSIGQMALAVGGIKVAGNGGSEIIALILVMLAVTWAHIQGLVEELDD